MQALRAGMEALRAGFTYDITNNITTNTCTNADYQLCCSVMLPLFVQLLALMPPSCPQQLPKRNGRRDGIFRYPLGAKRGVSHFQKERGSSARQEASNFPTSRRLRGCDFEFPGSPRRCPMLCVQGSRDGIFRSRLRCKRGRV